MTKGLMTSGRAGRATAWLLCIALAGCVSALGVTLLVTPQGSTTSSVARRAPFVVVCWPSLAHFTMGGPEPLRIFTQVFALNRLTWALVLTLACEAMSGIGRKWRDVNRGGLPRTKPQERAKWSRNLAFGLPEPQASGRGSPAARSGLPLRLCCAAGSWSVRGLANTRPRRWRAHAMAVGWAMFPRRRAPCSRGRERSMGSGCRGLGQVSASPGDRVGLMAARELSSRPPSQAGSRDCASQVAGRAPFPEATRLAVAKAVKLQQPYWRACQIPAFSSGMKSPGVHS